MCTLLFLVDKRDVTLGTSCSLYTALSGQERHWIPHVDCTLLFADKRYVTRVLLVEWTPLCYYSRTRQTSPSRCPPRRGRQPGSTVGIWEASGVIATKWRLIPASPPDQSCAPQLAVTSARVSLPMPPPPRPLPPPSTTLHPPSPPLPPPSFPVPSHTTYQEFREIADLFKVMFTWSLSLETVTHTSN